MRRFVRHLAAALAAAAVCLSSIAADPQIVQAGRRIHVDAFMTGLACVESSGRYTALNSSSRAYGKYQIMPKIWPAWAGRYLNDRWAPPNPRNQEYVARQRVLDLYKLHGLWRLVAHWWLTGNAQLDESTWSARSLRYVNEVLATAHAATSFSAQATIPAGCFPGDYRDPRIRIEPWPRVQITGGRIFMRVAAGYESPAIGTLRRGFVVAVLGKGRDLRGKPWLHVGLRDGSTAWIAGWYTEPATTR